MFGCIGKKAGLCRNGLLATGRVVALAGVMAGCSSVPDALKPTEWFSSAPAPEIATPRGQTADAAAKPPAEGLVADRSRAKYAEPVRRESAPTKPLAKRQPAAADPQTAATPVERPAQVQTAPVAPAGQPEAKASPTSAPVIASADGQPRVTPGSRTPSARDDGPAAPPASIDMNPPARPDIPETVKVPGRPRLVQQHFEKRLAESAQTVVRPDVVEPVGRSFASNDEPIHLIPPGTKRKGGAGKGMAAPEPQLAGPAASFQVASVDFRDGSSELTRADLVNLAEVARLYRQSGGVVRVVGMAPAPLVNSYNPVDQVMGGFDASMKRANAVARELTRRGVPAHKIMIGADPAPAGFGPGNGAKVYLDVI